MNNISKTTDFVSFSPISFGLYKFSIFSYRVLPLFIGRYEFIFQRNSFCSFLLVFSQTKKAFSSLRHYRISGSTIVCVVNWIIPWYKAISINIGRNTVTMINDNY